MIYYLLSIFGFGYKCIGEVTITIITNKYISILATKKVLFYNLISCIVTTFQMHHHFLSFSFISTFLPKDMTLCIYFAFSSILVPLFLLVRKIIYIRVCTCGLNANIARHLRSSYHAQISVFVDYYKIIQVSHSSQIVVLII